MSAKRTPPATFTCSACGKRHRVGILTGLPEPSRMSLAGFIHPDGGYSNACGGCGYIWPDASVRARGPR